MTAIKIYTHKTGLLFTSKYEHHEQFPRIGYIDNQWSPLIEKKPNVSAMELSYLSP